MVKKMMLTNFYIDVSIYVTNLARLILGVIVMKRFLIFSIVALISATTSVSSSELIECPSENFRTRPQNVQTEYLILHCVGMSEDWVLQNYTKSTTNGGLGVSANYYIPPKGDKAFQLVNPKDTAFHAGVSEWAGKAASHGLKGLNDLSIGIEIGCQEYGHIDSKTYFPYSFKPYTEEALERGIGLSKEVIKVFNIKPEDVLWHSDISPFRRGNKGEVILGKTDPGPSFPAKRFAQNGIGVWPLEDRIGDEPLGLNVKNLCELLLKIGFSFNPADELEAKYAVQAFLMHYLPQEIKWEQYVKQIDGPAWDGHISEDMIIRAQNLAAGKYLY